MSFKFLDKFGLPILLILGLMIIIGGGLLGAVLHQTYWQTMVPKPWDYNFQIEGPRTTYYCNEFVANDHVERIYRDCVSHRNIHYSFVVVDRYRVISEPSPLLEDYQKRSEFND